MICEYCDGDGWVDWLDEYDWVYWIDEYDIIKLDELSEYGTYVFEIVGDTSGYELHQGDEGFPPIWLCPSCDGYGDVSDLPDDVLESIAKFNNRTGFSRMYRLNFPDRATRLIIEFAWRGKRLFAIPLWSTRNIFRD